MAPAPIRELAAGRRRQSDWRAKKPPWIPSAATIARAAAVIRPAEEEISTCRSRPAEAISRAVALGRNCTPAATAERTSAHRAHARKRPRPRRAPAARCVRGRPSKIGESVPLAAGSKSPKPIRSNIVTAAAPTQQPHTLLRGNRDLSTSSTDAPTRANCRAAIEPAGPRRPPARPNAAGLHRPKTATQQIAGGEPWPVT